LPVGIGTQVPVASPQAETWQNCSAAQSALAVQVGPTLGGAASIEGDAVEDASGPSTGAPPSFAVLPASSATIGAPISPEVSPTPDGALLQPTTRATSPMRRGETARRML